MSTQWESQGYFYPTQIAQFGLSHYSKNLTEPEPRRKIFEDASSVMSEWIVPTGSLITRVLEPQLNTHVLHFQTTGSKYSLI